MMGNVQEIIDIAVRLATKAAMNGYPLARVIWIPPQSASDSPIGSFALQECGPINGSESPPWVS